MQLYHIFAAVLTAEAVARAVPFSNLDQAAARGDVAQIEADRAAGIDERTLEHRYTSRNFGTSEVAEKATTAPSAEDKDASARGLAEVFQDLGKRAQQAASTAASTSASMLTGILSKMFQTQDEVAQAQDLLTTTAQLNAAQVQEQSQQETAEQGQRSQQGSDQHWVEELQQQEEGQTSKRDEAYAQQGQRQTVDGQLTEQSSEKEPRAGSAEDGDTLDSDLGDWASSLSDDDFSELTKLLQQSQGSQLDKALAHRDTQTAGSKDATTAEEAKMLGQTDAEVTVAETQDLKDGSAGGMQDAGKAAPVAEKIEGENILIKKAAKRDVAMEQDGQGTDADDRRLVEEIMEWKASPEGKRAVREHARQQEGQQLQERFAQCQT